VGYVNGGSSMGAAGFFGPCVCLGILLLLSCRVLVSGIAGSCGYVNLVY
jgi:hypothetical protein